MSELINGSNGGNGSPPTLDPVTVGRGKLDKVDRSRRCWTDREEATLIVALKDLVATGWKSDNGFRAGWATRIEEALKRENPNTDLKAQPHIQSKVTAWKKYYYSLSSILARSGVGFNANNDYKIECDDEQWMQIVQKDSNAKYMRNKSWPHWDSWNEVFGKDRASGSRAKDSAEAVYKVPSAQANVEDNFTNYVGNNYPMNFEDLFPNEVLPQGLTPDVDSGSNTNAPNISESTIPNVSNEPNFSNGPNDPNGPNVPVAPTAANSPKETSRKRKAVDPMDKVVDLMKQMHEDTTVHLKTLSSRIGCQFDLSTKRAEVFSQLGVVPGLTLKHKFYVGQKLVKEPELMDLFRGLPEIARPEYVMFLLEEEGLI